MERATIQDWTALGVEENVAKAIVAYQHNPSLGTAAGVLKHYKYFSGQTADFRRQLFL